MSDRDNITLHKSDCALLLGGYQCTCGFHQRQNKTPTALAAETPKHPGYIIGSHWLETAYSRICAGEAEADVLRDCGWERVDQALRREEA